MFDTLREHIPAARTLTDDRLTAIVAASVLLLGVASTMGMSIGKILLGVAVAVVIARRIGGRQPSIVVQSAGAFEDADATPETATHRRERFAEDSTDPLLARAIALRERTLSRT